MKTPSTGQKIKHLPLDQAHKIAAGEVVERPANIVKELLENSLDAGATVISLYINDGGKELIRIVDNGSGMSPEDARVCFDKHATSKISSIDELESITTFGFRGEALASVAAIAQVTLITKEADTIEGIKLTVANSAIISEEPVAAQTGTDISVANLFYNVPARKKFLKKRETEWRHIQQLFQAFCLDYPHIHFKMYSEGKLLHNCPPMHELSERFANVSELTQANSMIPISAERSDINLSVSGIISDHQIMRFDRNGIFLFVNKRWIKNHELVRAILKGYQNVIPQGRYPLASISITIDPKQVDINIHPRKEEVKFIHPGMVENLISMAVKDALEKQLSRQIKREVRFVNEEAYQPAFREDQASLFNKFNTTLRYTDSSFHSESAPFDKLRGDLRANDWGNSLNNKNEEISEHSSLNNISSPLFALSSEQSEASSEYRKVAINSSSTHAKLIEQEINQNSNSSVRPELAKGYECSYPSHAQDEPNEEKFNTNSNILAQFNKTYILIQQESGLLFIDQHAAHERILYEQFRSNFQNIATVSLMFPQLIEFAKADLEALEPHLEFLNQCGIHAEIFGENQIKITAIPVHLKNASIAELLKELISSVYENTNTNAQDLSKIVHEKMHAQMACKAAVKAGDVLSHEQMVELIKNLNNTPHRFSCPHGRPTCWVLQLDDLEKKFKRDYRSY